MLVRYRLDENEFVAACNARSLVAPWSVEALGFLFVLAALAQFATKSSPWYLPAGMFLVGAFTLYVPFATQLALQRDPRFRTHFQMQVADSGIAITTNAVTEHLSWSEFREFRETNDLFLLYQSPKLVTPFPKRAFSPDEQAQFRALAAEKIPIQLPRDRAKTLRTVALLCVVVAAFTVLYVGFHTHP